jgi:hypothetical protein
MRRRRAQDVQVGAADAARFDFEQDLVVVPERRLVTLEDGERARLGKNGGLHDASSP